MKKTTVLIPGLALIAFSTVASIAGSVAWFTANRQTNINAGSYAVVNTTANLKHSVAAGVATSVASADATVVSVVDGNKLSDGSFDHIDHMIYQPNAQGDGFDATNPEVDATGAVNTIEPLLRRADLGSSKYVYTAITFTLNFTIDFTSKAGDYALFLNTYNTASEGSNKSRFETAENTDTGEGSESTVDTTAKGFRLGFYSASTNANKRVFAGLQTSSNCHYVGDNDGATDAYDFANSSGTWKNYSGDLVDSAYEEQLPTTSVARATAIARPDCLGYFAYQQNTSVTLSYTVVAWFEGTDPEIVNRDSLTEYQTVAAKLYFEAVPLANS